MSSWRNIPEIVSPIMWSLLSLRSRGYRMKLNNLSAGSVSRVTDVLGGTIMETLATPRVGAMNEEGLADAGLDG